MTDTDRSTKSKVTTPFSPGGPHWTPLHEIDSRDPHKQTHELLDELVVDVGVTSLPVKMRAEVLSSGQNVALRRWPAIEVEPQNLPKSPGLMPSWKPTRPKVTTFGLQFPEGMSLIAKAKSGEESAKSTDDAKPEGSAPPIEILPGYEPPTVASLIDGLVEEPKKKQVTRIKPPDDALAIEDRLFYLLQPPLQTWLAGQELIMPFEPFPYQYEGIGWLFSKSSALLADEMGLGKTMQTITAIRLLIRSGQARRVLLVCPKPLLPNWQREFRTWAEELPFVVVEGDGDRRKLTWTREHRSRIDLRNWVRFTNFWKWFHRTQPLICGSFKLWQSSLFCDAQKTW